MFFNNEVACVWVHGGQGEERPSTQALNMTAKVGGHLADITTHLTIISNLSH